MNIQIDLVESDFAEVASEEEKIRLLGKTRVLGDDAGGSERRIQDCTKEEILEQMLPRALVNKVKRMMPEDFELTEIQINAVVSANVFGTGLAGSFTMKLAKRE